MIPWISLLVCALAGAVYAAPAGAELFELRFEAVGEGEWWRLLTGHLTHYSLDHLAWDVGTFALLGGWLERTDRRRFLSCLALSLVAIPLVLLALRPELAAYRGLSGLDVALFATLAARLAGGAALLFLAALGGKLAFEVATGATLFVAPPALGVVPVPEAHVAGAVSAMLVAPKKNVMRRILDRVARALARLLLGVFYRRLEVEGAERIPADGPVVFVANHGNSLVDPIVMVGMLPRVPRFLAKSTLWSNPAVRPLLALGGAIPVYRREDAVDMAQNESTFARCHDELAAGGTVALFPEGISHDEPQLQPLKTGAARIVLDAERNRGPLGAKIVPIGLYFEEKTRFRSRALVIVGEPIDPAPEIARHADDEVGAVRDLTARVEAGLQGVTHNHPTWQEARLVERAVDVYVDAGRTLPGQAPLADRFTLRKTFAATYERLRTHRPKQAESVRQLLARYDALLERHALRDDQVSSRYPWSQVLLYLLDRLPVLAIWLPVAVVGTVLNWLPYRGAGLVADRFVENPDLPATYKLLGGFFLLPVAWLLEAIAAGLAFGPGAAFVTAILAPTSGWVALRFHERHQAFWRETAAYFRLRLRRSEAKELRECREAIRLRLRELASQLRPRRLHGRDL